MKDFQILVLTPVESIKGESYPRQWKNTLSFQLDTRVAGACKTTTYISEELIEEMDETVLDEIWKDIKVSVLESFKRRMK